MSKNQIFVFFFAFIPALVLADLTALIPESTIAVIADGFTAELSGWLEPGDVAAYLAVLEKIGVVL